MLVAYPIILHPDKLGYIVSSPDFDIDTQGKSIAEAIRMARDAISLTGITLQDMGRALPQPSTKSISVGSEDIITYVDVDFDAYRSSLDSRAIRKNCTIPAWLNTVAEKQKVNFSAVLQEGLMKKLNVHRPPHSGSKK